MGHIEELKRVFENRIAMNETKYLARTCMGRIDHDIMGKIEFPDASGKERFPHLKVSVFDRTNGLVDQMTFLMMDVIGAKQQNGAGIIPALINSDGKLVWNFDITEEDCEKLADAVNGYLEMFQSMEERQTQAQSINALPGNVIS